MSNDLQWPTVEEEDLKPFPPVIRAVVKALGFGHATKFLEQNGGRPVLIPKYKSTSLGIDRLQLQRLRESLADHMINSDYVTLPKADKLLAHKRNQIILAEMNHKSIQKQAKENNLTTRSVVLIRTGNTSRRSEVSFSASELALLSELAQKQAQKTPDPRITALADKIADAIKPPEKVTNDAQSDLF